MEELLRCEIIRFIAEHPGNHLPDSDSPYLDQPLIGIASRWSERHAAYAAGLGTFSLSDGFISSRGIAHRCGLCQTKVSCEAAIPPACRICG